MLRGGEGTRRSPRIDRMGGLVLAMIAGVLLPPIVVSALASRDPLPRDCGSGQATAAHVDGALLYTTTGADLWYSEGFPGHPRKLVDYAPARARIGASPAPTPSPSPSPSGSPTPSVPPAAVLAADISADRKIVAFIALDPTDRPTAVSLKMLSVPDAPAAAPTEAWFAEPRHGATDGASVKILDNGKILYFVPVAQSWLPVPSPAVSASASPSATPSPAFSPSPQASPTGGIAVEVVVPSPRPAIVDQAPQDYFLARAHSAWPDSRGYRVAPADPRLDGRVDGPTSKVSGRIQRVVTTPLASRRLNVIALGTAGQASTRPVCVAPAGTTPAALSPDESEVLLYDGQETSVLDLTGNHAPARLFAGKILAWNP